ncbi:hypothetical protein A9G06_09325 [Aeromonas sp. DNP9]|nr:hypothetical protein A9G06_09325 [Aeromonas sp. DNP9]
MAPGKYRKRTKQADVWGSVAVYRRGGANRDKWAEPRLSIWRMMALQTRQGAAWHKTKKPAKAGFSRSRPEGHCTKSMDITLR